jgi:serine/threonine-protein kinase
VSQEHRTLTEGGSTPAQQGPVPRAFGRYELIGEVARGGMGVVYKAWDTALNRLVALKTLQAEQGQQRPELVQRFLREPQAFARLSHPHIVPVFDVGLHDGQDYFAMGFMPGGSLAEHRDRFTEPRAAAALVEKVARAVHKPRCLPLPSASSIGSAGRSPASFFFAVRSDSTRVGERLARPR